MCLQYKLTCESSQIDSSLHVSQLWFSRDVKTEDFIKFRGLLYLKLTYGLLIFDVNQMHLDD